MLWLRNDKNKFSNVLLTKVLGLIDKLTSVYIIKVGIIAMDDSIYTYIYSQT